MRPRSLELGGFTAFRDPQRVDFTPLSLFAITGPTGSGKTSLLDAMGFALYGEVARMGRQGLGELVSHGKAEARVLLEFSVDGSTYRLSRRLPRKGAQQGKLEVLDGEQWVDAVERSGIRALNKAVEDLIKLDFESYCKAVVLPQGDFARFLKGDPADRRRTLVALLGLAQYERMAALARQRASELSIRGEQTRHILEEQFADATPEALAEAQGTLEAAIEAAEAATEQLGSARGLDRERSAAANRAGEAVGLVEQCGTLKRELSDERAACAQVDAESQAATAQREAALTAVTSAVDAVATATANAEQLTERVGGREQLSRLREAARRLVGLEQKASNNEQALAELAKRELEAQSELSTAQQLVQQAVTIASSAAEVEEEARAKCDGARSTHDETVRTLEAARAAEQGVEQAQLALIAARSTRDDAAAAAESATAAADNAERAREDVRREHSVAVLVAGLEPGDPCPVCAHPFESHPAVDGDAEARVNGADEAFAARRAEARSAAAALTEARNSVAQLERQHAESQTELADALGERENVQALTDAVTSAAEAVEAAKVAAAQAQTERVTADEALVAAREQSARVTQRVEGMVGERATLEGAASAALAERDEARGLLRARFGDDIPEDADARLGSDYEQVVAAEAGVTKAQESERAARAELATADERCAGAGEAATAIDLRLQQLRSRADVLAEQAARIAEPDQLVDLPEPVASRDTRAEQLVGWCEQTARDLDQVGETATAAAEEAAKLLVALAASAGIETGADLALTAIERSEREAAAARVRSEESFKLLEQRAGQRAQLEGEVSSGAQHVAVLEVLANELRANRFVDFVIQETLDLLAVRASEELLRVSDGRYRLVSREGHFDVVDQMNADEMRSVKTLSGGETFMASLSLALALSKHVTELAGEGMGAHLEAVFIDEGFGSLDAETLEEVIDALERLREEDLLVGVISHVPELAARIDEGLEVRKEGTRSVVVQS